jgi:hypothetical protein
MPRAIVDPCIALVSLLGVTSISRPRESCIQIVSAPAINCIVAAARSRVNRR